MTIFLQLLALDFELVGGHSIGLGLGLGIWKSKY